MNYIFMTGFWQNLEQWTLKLTIMRFLHLIIVRKPNPKDDFPPTLHLGLSVGGSSLGLGLLPTGSEPNGNGNETGTEIGRTSFFPSLHRMLTCITQ